MRTRAITGLVVAILALLPLTAARAVDLGDLGAAVIKTVAVGAVVNAVAAPLDTAVNRIGGAPPPGTGTKIVPVLSFGRKAYVGAAQVAGAADLVARAKAVLQFETEFQHGGYRIKILAPVDSVNPFDVHRVRGLGITGLTDIGLTRGAYAPPLSAGFGLGDVLRGGAILVAVNQFGPQINSFINSVARTRGMGPEGATKVVPYLSVGAKAYLGAMQVAGPAHLVNRVKAVWQYEGLFDQGRTRLRVLVPSDSLNPLDIRRVRGVGATAIIDTVFLRTRSEPDEFSYLRRTGIFIGDEDGYRPGRPPGWDRGLKMGWILHGDPYLPPGLSKKIGPRGGVIIVPGREVIGERRGPEEQIRGRLQELAPGPERPGFRSPGPPPAKEQPGPGAEKSGPPGPQAGKSEESAQPEQPGARRGRGAGKAEEEDKHDHGRGPK